MKYTEEKRSFTLPKDYMLVHCISADFAMGAGIARRFTLLGVRDALYKCQAYGSLHTRGYFDGKGYCIITGEDICGWKVANLITKNKYYDKPTYDTLRDALHDLKNTLNTSLMLKSSVCLLLVVDLTNSNGIKLSALLKISSEIPITRLQCAGYNYSHTERTMQSE